MKILLTGGTGKYGQSLLAGLLEDGHAVHTAQRTPLNEATYHCDWRDVAEPTRLVLNMIDRGHEYDSMVFAHCMREAAKPSSPNLCFSVEDHIRVNCSAILSVVQFVGMYGRLTRGAKIILLGDEDPAGHPDEVPYFVSKRAMQALAQYIAPQIARSGVSVAVANLPKVDAPNSLERASRAVRTLLMGNVIPGTVLPA